MSYIVVKGVRAISGKNFGRVLTRGPRRRRLTAMTPYHRLLDESIGERPVLQVAREWGVPQWVLYDGLREEAKSPSGKYLGSVARGLGMTTDELLDKVAPQEAVT